MKKLFGFNLLQLILMAIFMAILLPVSVFSGGPDQDEEIKIGTDELVVCPEPRPQICTMDYNPVCAQVLDGSFRVYSNACTACSDPEVVGYHEGECTAEK